MNPQAKAVRISHLNTVHTASYNSLSPSAPTTLAAHASAQGITQTEASHRLQLLVDEGLVAQARDSKGKPLGTYTQV